MSTAKIASELVGVFLEIRDAWLNAQNLLSEAGIHLSLNDEDEDQLKPQLENFLAARPEVVPQEKAVEVMRNGDQKDFRKWILWTFKRSLEKRTRSVIAKVLAQYLMDGGDPSTIKDLDRSLEKAGWMGLSLDKEDQGNLAQQLQEVLENWPWICPLEQYWEVASDLKDDKTELGTWIWEACIGNLPDPV